VVIVSPLKSEESTPLTEVRFCYETIIEPLLEPPENALSRLMAENLTKINKVIKDKKTHVISAPISPELGDVIRRTLNLVLW
jgi:hypothetical protein